MVKRLLLAVSFVCVAVKAGSFWYVLCWKECWTALVRASILAWS